MIHHDKAESNTCFILDGHCLLVVRDFFQAYVLTEYALFYHRIIELKNLRFTEWLGLEGTLKTVWLQPPVIGRAAPNSSGCPEAHPIWP